MATTDILRIVITPLAEITKCITTPLKREISYLVHYKTNVENLKNQVENLIPKKNDVNGLVEVARRKNEVIKEEVQKWMTRVAEIEVDMRRLDEEVNQNKMCFMRWCPNCSWRYGLGKEAMKKTQDAKDLLNEGNFSTVSLPAPPPSIEYRPVGDFETFESIGSHMNQIVNALKEENINTIGVYGMGGVGKTTLVTEVAKQVKRERLCDEVIMVTISRNPNIKTIQRDLAENLGMKFEEENEDLRAGQLMKRLQQEKTVLVILDDLWEELELAKIGIPYKGVPKGCKIVFTSRDLDVCTQMRCQVNIEVKVLSDEDSWDLFRMKTDGAVDSPTLHDVARDVVKECGGLPLAIVTLAGALRNKDLLVWEDALVQLKRSSPSNIPGMNKKVYSSLMLSYNHIESDETKLLFLFCCLFPEDYEIHVDYLLIYGMGEGLFLNVNTLEEARGRLHTMVQKLKASSLLLNGKGRFGIALSFSNINKEFVKMHDLVRDVAISIASNTDNGFLAKPNAGLEEWYEMEQLKQCKRISLMHNNISEFSGIPECPHIRTLLLQCNPDFSQIQDSFFQGMKSLVVLDLSFTSISSLMTSISCLKNLRTLNLGGSNLRELSLQGLEKLEVLILCDTAIPELPAEIGRLSNLKLLDLTNTPKIKVPGNTISKLRRLEELYMRDSFCDWEVEQTQGGMGKNMASFAEIASLPALRILKVQVINGKCLSQDISSPWKNLKAFVICVDDMFIDSPLSSPRSMRLNMLWFKSNPVSDWVKELLERTDELSLVGTMPLLKPTIDRPTVLVAQQEEECRDSTSILQADLLQRLHNLTELKVENCSHWKEVFCYEGRERDQALLSKLRKLKLENLLGVTRIWNGIVPFGTMHNLEKLLVIRCGSLSNIFSLSLSRSIQQLGKLRIEECHSMENIISVEDNKLQQLQSSTIFQNLQKITIIKCNKLKHLLPMSLASGLQRLEVLSIRKCEGIEVIIAEEEITGIDKVVLVLPLLTHVRVDDLPKLKSFFYQVRGLELPSLVFIEIWGCPNLKRFPLGPESAPNLDEIKGDENWFRELEWEEESFKSRLQPLLNNRRGAKHPFPYDSDEPVDCCLPCMRYAKIFAHHLIRTYKISYARNRTISWSTPNHPTGLPKDMACALKTRGMSIEYMANVISTKSIMVCFSFNPRSRCLRKPAGDEWREEINGCYLGTRICEDQQGRRNGGE
ncbi:hypothetical protein HHK36_018635 [Tetracentron sinense]|uniref:AAA+ ATPase domain-containing protein n=1 Tax=Tetracentron sinense TaxID=13715 RepID=A0A834Z4R0_TETSI|nr:hypothetical protein HHK36_018635 [Tetracentron sinense]